MPPNAEQREILTEVARTMRASGADVDQIAQALLRRTDSPIAAIRAVVEGTGLGLGDAKWVSQPRSGGSDRRGTPLRRVDRRDDDGRATADRSEHDALRPQPSDATSSRPRASARRVRGYAVLPRPARACGCLPLANLYSLSRRLRATGARVLGSRRGHAGGRGSPHLALGRHPACRARTLTPMCAATPRAVHTGCPGR
jgi:hypothetical protein